MGILIGLIVFLAVFLSLHAAKLKSDREKAAAGLPESRGPGCGVILLIVALVFVGLAIIFVSATNSANKSAGRTSASASGWRDTRPAVSTTRKTAASTATPKPSPRPSATPIRITPRPTATRSPKQITVQRRAPTPPPQTLAKLSPSPSPTVAPTAFRALQSGDTGTEVTIIQTRLAALGFLNDTIDGIFGKKTKQAVADFQAANGLSSTGIVNDKTYALLFSFSASNAAPRLTATLRPTATPLPAAAKKAAISAYTGEDYRDSASKGTTYVLNTNTRKFHRPGCRYVSKIKPKNYREYTGSRGEVISMGYDPCQVCGP